MIIKKPHKARISIRLFDSHCHLDDRAYDKDSDDVIHRMHDAGVASAMTIGTTLERCIKGVAIAESIPGVYASVGIHPHGAKSCDEDVLKTLKDLAGSPSVRAWGEIGLDFHYDFSPRQEQEKAFRHQLSVAQKLGLPVVVHSRNAGKEVAKAVEEEHFSKGCILHCFTEDWALAKRMMDHNFFISFSGILTFPKAQPLREIAKKIPLEKLLVETDSPYLIPLAYRGIKKRNEPAHVIEIAKVLAELKKTSLEKLAWATSKNFESLFCLK